MLFSLSLSLYTYIYIYIYIHINIGVDSWTAVSRLGAPRRARACKTKVSNAHKGNGIGAKGSWNQARVLGTIPSREKQGL